MRVPRTPPEAAEVLNTANASRLLELMQIPEPEGYMHWDEFRFQPPPEDATIEEWWIATKMHRTAKRKLISLKDSKQLPFSFNITEQLHEDLHNIDLKAGGTIEAPDAITNQRTRDRYFIHSLIHEATTSSQLEGAVTTRQVAKEMIRTGREPLDKSERMILNNYKTMRFITEVKNEDLTPELIFKLHSMVTEGTLETPNGSGRFRLESEKVYVYDDEDNVIHTPPSASELPNRLSTLCEFACNNDPKQFIHPVIRAIIVHFWLAYDHPFIDGNGRTARALFYWCMHKYEYWLFEFISISSILSSAPIQYARAFLQTENDDNDLTYFVCYQINVIQRAIKELHQYIDRKTNEISETQKLLRNLTNLNYRQQSLITHALKHPYQTYTIESHKNSHGVAYQTSRSDLINLAKIGLITMSKKSKEFVFGVPADLDERISKINSIHQRV